MKKEMMKWYNIHEVKELKDLTEMKERKMMM